MLIEAEQFAEAASNGLDVNASFAGAVGYSGVVGVVEGCEHTAMSAVTFITHSAAYGCYNYVTVQ